MKFTINDIAFATDLLDRCATFVRSEGRWTIFVKDFGPVAQDTRLDTAIDKAKHRVRYLVAAREAVQAGRSNVVELASFARNMRHKEAKRGTVSEEA